MSQPSDAITFWVYDHDNAGHIVDRPGVQCRLLRCDGELDLGVSDSMGKLRVSHAALFESGALAILFCTPSANIACTAVRLDPPLLRSLTEFNVRVTPYEIIDSVMVKPTPHHPKSRLGR